ncbi:Apolipoprotein N-acyltransferase [Pseudoalteromonas sp. CIP111854]|uniref:Apolipoprotein N-acyltransferase n=1 Tax=Pseudoalteromonas holothuriae TaxID=2963714 RepID=A0A9W4QQZ2_9GAMM|nr:apolipoprotein N-acyltransferase [Pseudoalteromonas sp. CIP111854]CAH9049517.1 Apolipoprotein N-acyltransferase [Pseudoalteromonas sp. CIP111854]
MATTKLSKPISAFKDKQLWLAFFAGLSLTFSYAPFALWPLVFIAIAIACYATDTPNLKQAAKYGFVFGFGWFALGISWVHVSIAQYGGLPLPISLLLMAMLCAYLALYPMLAFMLASYFTDKPWQRICMLIVGFAIFEWLRGTLLTGFPWLSFGYTLTDSPLNALAPFIGEFGLSLLCVMVGCCLYYTWQCSSAKPLIAASITTFTLIGLAISVSKPQHSEQHIKTLLVQGNIQQSLRWEPEHFWPTMSKYRDMTRPHWHDVDLVLWPEAAIPEIEDFANPFLKELDKAAAFNNTALITGIPDYQINSKTVYNTLIVLGKKQPDDTQGHYQYLHTNRYQKHQLLPIGEFVPFEDILRPLAPLFDLAMSSFSRGERVQNNLIANGLHILPAICFEIAFSELVRDNFTEQSNILFTVSNDAWFGDSHGPHQHMQIARMRALELQRPLIRATNNGITGVYDPITKQQYSIAQFKADVLKADINLITGNTFFSQFGHIPVWVIVCLSGFITLGNRFLPKVLRRFERSFL